MPVELAVDFFGVDTIREPFFLRIEVTAPPRHPIKRQMVTLDMNRRHANMLTFIRENAFKSIFACLTILASSIAAVRLCWSWPNALWQSEFWIFNDINNLVNHHFSSVTWFEAGTRDWSLNVWRWFSYFNAYFFGWNMYLEIIAYYAIVATLSLFLGFEMVKHLQGRYRYSIYLIPVVLLSLVGAGSRGMELGTYFGILITVVLIIELNKPTFSRSRIIVLPALLVFGTSGGYALPTLFSLLLVFLILTTVGRKSSFQFLNLRKIFFTIVSLSAWLSIYAILFIKNGGLNNSGAPTLSEILKKDHYYFFKFLFFGQSGALVSNQTLEGSRSSQHILDWISLFLTIFTLISVSRIRKESIQNLFVPLCLISYSFGVALIILVTRPTGDTGLLATWYGLHLKIGLIGLIWVWVLTFQRRVPSETIGNIAKYATRFYLITPLFIVLVIVASANLKQIHREPSERNYFLNIQNALLYPEEMKVDRSGLTPLLIPEDQSKTIISQMRKDRLNVYTQEKWFPSGIPGTIGAFKIFGTAYSDGWIGTNSQILMNSSSCSTWVLRFSAYSPSLPNTLTVDINHARSTTHIFQESKYLLTLHNLKGGDLISLNFSKSIVPTTIGKGPDQRALSSLLQMQCAGKR